MRNYTKLYIVLFCLSLIFTMGMSSTPRDNHMPAEKPLQDNALTNFLAQVKLAYEKRSFTNFMVLVDSDFPGRLEFEANLQQQFSSFKWLAIDFSVDTLLTDAGRISVRLRWFRKSRDTAGVMDKQQDSCQFILNSGTEGYKLLQIRGANPFF
ncbi:MAG: hypothetical protein JSW18_00145 [Candidatus Omnitrophota bacterium]|nr:MAG: hypothetical protein JSW18_00145 [Candidatus Omnitrophota bacterium]